MRTLAVLSTVLLLAFQTHAEPIGESTEELPAQEQTEAQVQDIAISFSGDERIAREIAGPQQRAACYCRTKACPSGEISLGTCTLNSKTHKFCCR
nr:defensin alpha 5-like [Dasypus novemcinctus]